jgi:hypothetical protein
MRWRSVVTCNCDALFSMTLFDLANGKCGSKRSFWSSQRSPSHNLFALFRLRFSFPSIKLLYRKKLERDAAMCVLLYGPCGILDQVSIETITPRSSCQVVAMRDTALSGALSRQSLVIVFVSELCGEYCVAIVYPCSPFCPNPFFAQMALSTSTRITSQESPAAAAKPMCMSARESRTEMKCGIDREF